MRSVRRRNEGKRESESSKEEERECRKIQGVEEKIQKVL